MSGCSPAAHGIYGFRAKDGALFSSKHVQVPRLWDMVKPSQAFFFPLTFPVTPRSAREGLVAAVAPAKGAETGCRAVSAPFMWEFFAAHRLLSAPSNFSSLLASLRKKLQAWERLLVDERFPWRFSAMMLSEIDTAMLSRLDKQQQLFAEVDHFLEGMWEELNDGETAIILVSDHGSVRVKWNFDLGAWLRAAVPEDWQKVQIDGWGNLWCDDSRLLDVIETKLKHFVHRGRMILDVWKGEQIFPGLKDAPHLVVWPRRELGYSQQPRLGQVVAPARKQGCHLFEGIFACWGPGIKVKRIQGRAVDFVPTVLHLLGETIPPDLEGEALL